LFYWVSGKKLTQLTSSTPRFGSDIITAAAGSRALLDE
jgi:hypothetical protein